MVNPIAVTWFCHLVYSSPHLGGEGAESERLPAGWKGCSAKQGLIVQPDISIVAYCLMSVVRKMQEVLCLLCGVVFCWFGFFLIPDNGTVKMAF